MNARQLFKQSGEREGRFLYEHCGVWYCGECGTVAWNKETAEKCCVPHKCIFCGKPSETRQCDECFNAQQTKLEQERFEKAEKIKTWGGWVFCADWGTQNGFFRGLDEFLDYIATEDDRSIYAPNYVWTCKENRFVQVDIQSLCEGIAENGYEDFDISDLLGLTEFESAIAAFEKANESAVSYEPDYTKALILSD